MLKFLKYNFVIIIIALLGVIGYESSGLREYLEKSDNPQSSAPIISPIENGNLSLPSSTTNQERINQKPVDDRLNYQERIDKANYFVSKGFLSLATNELAIASQLEPKRIEPLSKLANIFFLLGDYSKAQKNLEKALIIDPQDLDIKVLLGRIYIKNSQFKEAKQFFSDISTNGQYVLYYKALLEILANNHTAAQGYLTEAVIIKADPIIAEYIDKLLATYQEYNLYSDGQLIFLQTMLAQKLNLAGEYEMTVALLKTVLKSKSDYRDAWIVLGHAYLNLEEFNSALTAFDKAYRLDTEKAETQYFLGLTYQELKQYKEAIAYLEVALKNGFEPRIQVLQILAEIYVKNEDYKKSVQAYEEILKLNDNDINTFVKPIWIYIDYLQNPAKAKQLSILALKKHPENAMSYNLMAWSYLAIQDYENAEKFLRQALKLNPQFAPAYLNLGKLLELNNKYEGAKLAYQKAYELDEEGNIGNNAAKSYNNIITKEKLLIEDQL